MRKILLLAGTILLGTNAADAAPPKFARTVQLIFMGSGPTVKQETLQTASEISGPRVEQFSARPANPIHAIDHDLRTVQIQMANIFMEQGETEQKPWIGADVSEHASLSNTASAIAVPSWMTGGPLPTRVTPDWGPGCLPVSYRPTGFLRVAAELRRQSYYGLMSHIACEFGIPVGLFDAMIIQESRYRHHVFSPKNAYGLTQLMPDTAAELGVNRYAVDQNLRGGARYLRRQLDRFGQVHLALAAYNAGPGRVRKAMVPPIRETRLYVDEILRNWSRLSGLAVQDWPWQARPYRVDAVWIGKYRVPQVSIY